MAEFLDLRPESPVLSPDELMLWCSAQTAYDTAHAEAEASQARTLVAYETERARGYSDGREVASREMAQHILATAHTSERALLDIEASLPGIVADVIEDMLGRVDLNEVLPIAIRHGLARVRRGTAARLRIAADCAEALQSLVMELYQARSPITVEIDPALTPGRCVLESDYGSADLGLEAQLRVLRESLDLRWQSAAAQSG